MDEIKEFSFSSFKCFLTVGYKSPLMSSSIVLPRNSLSLPFFLNYWTTAFEAFEALRLFLHELHRIVTIGHITLPDSWSLVLPNSILEWEFEFSSSSFKCFLFFGYNPPPIFSCFVLPSNSLSLPSVLFKLSDHRIWGIWGTAAVSPWTPSLRSNLPHHSSWFRATCPD